MTSLTWIKRITGIGLSLMNPAAQKERMNRVFDGNTINGPALAQLIDECKAAAGAFLEKNSTNDEQKNKITDILRQTDGKQIATNIDDEADIDWLLELRERVYNSGLRIENLNEL